MIKQKFWHALFEASVLIKAINGAWETISGFAILFLSKNTINWFFYTFTGKAGSDNSHEKILSTLTLGMQNLSEGARSFAGIYILAHGLINIFLAYNLYRERMWSFGVSLAFFSLSIVYLFYKLLQKPSLILFALIIFDVIFNYLTWHEYKYRIHLMEQRRIEELL